jgi:CRISPR-associated endonuclease/helicase Cas3
MNFPSSFAAATGNPPYDWQGRLACGEGYCADDPETHKLGAPCESKLIDIPTGLGKTAGVVMAWLWNRVLRDPENAQSDFAAQAMSRSSSSGENGA